MSNTYSPTDAENIHQVFDWLWTSGQLSEDDIACLPGLGIEAVINLAPPTSSNALSSEAELVTLKGIAYFQIPVAWERPELQQLDQFIGVLKAFEGSKVWVHCAKNMRVSAFIYLYRRIHLQDNKAAASFPMRDVWVPNEIWKAFILSALASTLPILYLSDVNLSFKGKRYVNQLNEFKWHTNATKIDSLSHYWPTIKTSIYKY